MQGTATAATWSHSHVHTLHLATWKIAVPMLNEIPHAQLLGLLHVLATSIRRQCESKQTWMQICLLCFFTPSMLRHRRIIHEEDSNRILSDQITNCLHDCEIFFSRLSCRHFRHACDETWFLKVPGQMHGKQRCSSAAAQQQCQLQQRGWNLRI